MILCSGNISVVYMQSWMIRSYIFRDIIRDSDLQGLNLTSQVRPHLKCCWCQIAAVWGHRIGCQQLGRYWCHLRRDLLSPAERRRGYSNAGRPSVRPSVTHFNVSILSALVLQNYWLEFDKTVWEASLYSGDAHIVCMFRSDDFSRSYGPLAMPLITLHRCM